MYLILDHKIVHLIFSKESQYYFDEEVSTYIHEATYFSFYLLLEQQKNMEALGKQSSHNFTTGMLEQQKMGARLESQSSQQYASLLLEQQKSKEHMSVQLADAKYEALKNKESLSAQMAVAAAESKYEALKNTQTKTTRTYTDKTQRSLKEEHTHKDSKNIHKQDTRTLTEHHSRTHRHSPMR